MSSLFHVNPVFMKFVSFMFMFLMNQSGEQSVCIFG